MADFKRDIEDALLTDNKLLWMYKEFRGFNSVEKKHLKSKITKLKTDVEFDLDEVVIALQSDEEILYHIHVKTVMNSMNSMEGGNYRKVIYGGYDIAEEKGIYTAEVRFILVNNTDKETDSIKSTN